LQNQPRHPWFIFGLICIPILIGSVDLTAIVVILPQATLDLLGPQGLARANDALWAVTAYLLAYTISLALVGRLSDTLPRKRVFLVCIVIFIIGALWSGFATDFPLRMLRLLPIWPEPVMLPLISLVIGRIIQAIGAGASVSVGMAMVSDIFPPEKRAEPISLIGALDSLGWVIGNLYAGLMLQVLPSWRSLFLINAFVASAGFIITVIALRSTATQKTSGIRYDWRGALLFAALLIALTLGVEALNQPSVVVYGLLISTIPLFVVFIVAQLRIRNALIDVRFVRQPEVSAALITNLIVGFGLILVVAGVPLAINLRAVFLRGEGLLVGALRAGVMLSALTIPLVVAALVGEGRYRKVGVGVPVAFGLLLAVIGFIGTFFWNYTAPNVIIALPLSLIGVGLGLTIGPLSLAVIDAAPEAERGLASSLVLVMRLLGMTVGTPLAASLTLNVANDWANQQAALATVDFQNVARTMLIPPLTIEALTHVMAVGAAACTVGLVVFYLPRMLRTVRTMGLRPRVLFAGMPILAVVIVLVGGASFWDSGTTPTIVPNPIARQLPPNVDFYAGFNVQQAFLVNSKRPLDAIVDIVRVLSGYVDPADTAKATTSPTPEATAGATATPEATPATTPTLAATAAATPSAEPTGEPPDTVTDTIVKLMFRPRQWTQARYKPFCINGIPKETWAWQDCFNQALGGWIGPQAAFALLPRTRSDYDFLFVLQATNRSNAISFATLLAIALEEQPPVQIANDVRILDIHPNQPDARQLAITDAYVVIGTPRAVSYMLNHGNASLADQPTYQAVTEQLPSPNFATIYYRASSFDAELKPALNSLFQSQVVDAISRVLGQLSPLTFIRTSSTPAVVGMSLRVNESQIVMDAIANLPFSLQRLNALPIPRDLYAQIPSVANGWVVTNLNIAGLAREIDIPDTLQTIARESGSADVRALLGNPLAQGTITAFARTIQNVLSYARGQIMLVTLPADMAKGALIRGALLMPLADQQSGTAAAAVQSFRAQLGLLSAVSGGNLVVRFEKAEGVPSEIVTITAPALEGLLPTGVHFTLLPDDTLLVVAGQNITDYLAMTRQSSVPTLVNTTFPDAGERFLMAYITPPNRWSNPFVLLTGEIRQQTMYLNAVLQPK